MGPKTTDFLKSLGFCKSDSDWPGRRNWSVDTLDLTSWGGLYAHVQGSVPYHWVWISVQSLVALFLWVLMVRNLVQKAQNTGKKNKTLTYTQRLWDYFRIEISPFLTFIFVCRHGQITDRVPGGSPLPPRWALQHPRDWLDAASAAIAALEIRNDEYEVRILTNPNL